LKNRTISLPEKKLVLIFLFLAIWMPQRTIAQGNWNLNYHGNILPARTSILKIIQDSIEKGGFLDSMPGKRNSGFILINLVIDSQNDIESIQSDAAEEDNFWIIEKLTQILRKTCGSWEFKRDHPAKDSENLHKVLYYLKYHFAGMGLEGPERLAYDKIFKEGDLAFNKQKEKYKTHSDFSFIDGGSLFLLFDNLIAAKQK